MRRVQYQSFWEHLEECCKKKNDTTMFTKVGGDFSKLPALEAQYHKDCHATYTKATYVKKTPVQSVYQDAFNTFSSFLEPQLKKGRAFEMSKLTEKYKEILMELGVPCDEVEKYRTQTLKSRILNAFSDKE